jgi:hypothetical protein
MEANMQRRSLKILTIFLIFILTLFCFFNNVYATNDNVVAQNTAEEVVAGDLSNNTILENNNSEEDMNIQDEENDEDEDLSSESHEDEVYSTGVSENKVTNSTTSTSTKQIKNYSTYSTLPEANLGLNNILNVILIAIGVIIILLAIAILIRLKQ